MSFVKSLTRWKAAERIFARYLNDYEWVISVEQSKWRFYDWDIKLTYEKNWVTKEVTYEVKCDRKSEETGNFCIEYFNTRKQEPSGISTSKADYYVYFADSKRWIAKRSELLVNLIWNNLTDLRDWGNNNSKMVILPVKFLSEWFEELTDLTEIPE